MSTVVEPTFSRARLVRDPNQQSAFDRLFRRIGEVSTFPAAAARIMAIAGDDTKGFEDLQSAVETDPALAVKVLRTVNSTLYSVRQRVADLGTAVALLGFNQVRNLALTMHVSRMFSQTGDYRGYSRALLWRHLVSVAAASRLIAQECGSKAADSAYTAGLLHDLGYVLLDQHLRKHFKELLDRLYAGETTDVLMVEREVFNFDHAELGEYVARQWNFAESVCLAAGFHHSPEEYSGEHEEIVDIVAVADYVCARHGVLSLGMGNPPPAPQPAFNRLEITAPRLQAILDKFDETLAFADRTATL